MFQHFPKDFFEYIAIIAAFLIVLAFPVWFLKKAVRPGVGTLMKRFREAYANHHCPICAFPIARGPLKQAIWTRKGPRLIGPSASQSTEDDAYACPSCGTQLYEACEECQSQRHCLLPYCDHCGHERAVTEFSDS